MLYTLGESNIGMEYHATSRFGPRSTLVARDLTVVYYGLFVLEYHGLSIAIQCLPLLPSCYASGRTATP